MHHLSHNFNQCLNVAVVPIRYYRNVHTKQLRWAELVSGHVFFEDPPPAQKKVFPVWCPFKAIPRRCLRQEQLQARVVGFWGWRFQGRRMRRKASSLKYLWLPEDRNRKRGARVRASHLSRSFVWANRAQSQTDFLTAKPAAFYSCDCKRPFAKLG